MLIKSLIAVVVAAAAARVVTAAQPKRMMMRSAPEHILPGHARRDDFSPYTPGLVECGEGNSCEEACGFGYALCSLANDIADCYNMAGGETCCLDSTGDHLGLSCDKNFACALDNMGKTYCDSANESTSAISPKIPTAKDTQTFHRTILSTYAPMVSSLPRVNGSADVSIAKATSTVTAASLTSNPVNNTGMTPAPCNVFALLIATAFAAFL